MLGFILGTKSYASSITSNESETIEETPCEINTRLDKELKTINKAFNNLSNRKFEDIHDIGMYLVHKVEQCNRIITEVQNDKDLCNNLIKSADKLIIKFQSIHDLENYVDNKQIKKETKSKKVKTIWKPW